MFGCRDRKTAEVSAAKGYSRQTNTQACSLVQKKRCKGMPVPAPQRQIGQRGALMVILSHQHKECRKACKLDQCSWCLRGLRAAACSAPGIATLRRFALMSVLKVLAR